MLPFKLITKITTGLVLLTDFELAQSGKFAADIKFQLPIANRENAKFAALEPDIAYPGCDAPASQPVNVTLCV